ncbi:endonuclease Q family protein [Longirhabdus pacifica]|uniref:endonuclease Q family protein n=1 Tax=Longirhabdus pacifica TaxID=2305227 RepID=UPI001F0BCA46|nr:endonuclease Q family protein [Longirhabdus pacifica]
MNRYFADLHIHIGVTEKGQAVKITGSKQLTLFNILEEASDRKGMDIIGIIDCHSPGVQAELQSYINRGEMHELAGGGIRFRNTTLLLGCEMEVKEPGMGPVHVLAYFPDLKTIQQFTTMLRSHVTNVHLSSQRVYMPSKQLQQEIVDVGGMFIPAHIFTPFKSVYGSGTDEMQKLFDMKHIHAVELGLSADTTMASYLSELDDVTFLSNSDAHSVGKIGREYNELQLKEANFQEWVKSVKREDGRKVTANYGLNPKLGKYYRTCCRSCGTVFTGEEGITDGCPTCHRQHIVCGVKDRILKIADRKEPKIASHHPPYFQHIPLSFIPGVGSKTLEKLLDHFGTEMNIIHRVPYEKLAECVKQDIASNIVKARKGLLDVNEGGGGVFGRIKG